MQKPRWEDVNSDNRSGNKRKWLDFEDDPTRFAVGLEEEIESKDLKGNFNIWGRSSFPDTIDRL